MTGGPYCTCQKKPNGVLEVGKSIERPIHVVCGKEIKLGDLSTESDELVDARGRIAWIQPFLVDPPPGWIIAKIPLDGAWYLREDKLSVIVTGSREIDGKRWLHVSVARPNKMPTWEEYRDVARLFLPEDAWAYQVIAPKARYINRHPYCLHMFACADGPQLPDFTRGGNTL